MKPTPGPGPVRIFLIGLGEALARSVARYVSGDPRVALIGVAPSVALAELLLPATSPDLAILDWAALGQPTASDVHLLRRDRPGLCVFFVVDGADPYRGPAARAGADAVISSERFAEEFEALFAGFFPGRGRAARRSDMQRSGR